MDDLLHPLNNLPGLTSRSESPLHLRTSVTYAHEGHTTKDQTVQTLPEDSATQSDPSFANSSTSKAMSRPARPLIPLTSTSATGSSALERPNDTLMATVPAHHRRAVTQAIMTEQLKRLKEEFAEKLHRYLQKMDPTRRRREAEEHDRLMQLLVEQHRLWEEGKLCRDLADEAARIKAVEAARVQLQAEVARGSLEEDFQSYQASMKDFIAEMKKCDTLAKFEAATSAMPHAGLHHGSP